MNVPKDMHRVFLQTRDASHRRRRRLLSAADNGAIIEHMPVSGSSMVSPLIRIPVPPRHTLTRPRLVTYYKTLTGKKPSLIQGDPMDEGYNYTWFTPAYTDGGTIVPKSHHRLQKALLAARISPNSLNERIQGVFDSGHLSSPIYRYLQCTVEENIAVDGMNEATSESIRSDLNAENHDILLVWPLAWELLSEKRMVAEELARVAPKGREWDRQHAMRHSIGTTAQEAIIDRCIDTRYRRPGDYVRHNNRGEPVDARGRPMRAVAFTTRKGELREPNGSDPLCQGS